MGRDEQGVRVTGTLAEFAAGLTPGAVPGELRAVIGRSLLDQIGVILAAGTLGADCRAFVATAREGGGQGAPIIGHDAEASPALAALANGAMAHALDFEETHDATLVHPSAFTVPAALAVAGQAEASGAELIAALVAGSEVAIRIAASFEGDPQAGNRFFVLPLVGAFGAAAAAGRLLRLRPDEMGHAFGLAMSQVVGSAAVLTEADSSFREVRDGFNAKAGVVAAQLARRGVRSVSDVFEGPAGYYALFQNGRFETRAFDGLGRDFEAGRISFKPWPACRGAHVHIEAALDLAERNALAAGDIASVEVEVSPFFATLCEPVELRRAPETASAAKFSIPYSVAVALVDGRVDLASFAEARRADPRIRKMASKVSHRVVDLPQDQSTRGAVTIITNDGRRLRAAIDTPLGHPGRPMGAAALEEKFRRCAAHAASAGSRDKAERLIETVARLDRLEAIGRELSPLL